VTILPLPKLYVSIDDDDRTIEVVPVLWCWIHGDATIYRTPKNDHDWYCRTWNSYNGYCDISARRMEAR